MSFKNIIVEVKENIAYVKINRPKAMNTLNAGAIEELDDAFTSFSEDRNVLGVILTGEGRAFCAGNDISQQSGAGSENMAEGLRDSVSRVHRLFNKIENFERPVIGAVNGYALGGGCELSLCCDIRIASTKAKFGLPEVGLGVIPCYGGPQRLPRLVGIGVAKELIYTGKHIGADKAKEIGLVNSVVEPEELLNEAEKLMKEIVSKAPIAIKYAKICVNRGQEMSLDYALELEKDMIALLATTEDSREGGMAFFEKRTPKFKNK